jgi:hypothetical protein
VLNPAPTKALFMVADGTGGHAFADTLAISITPTWPSGSRFGAARDEL